MIYTEHRLWPSLAPHLECLWLVCDGELNSGSGTIRPWAGAARRLEVG